MLTRGGRAANFTNEVGVGRWIRYLRNVMGMWVLNECVSRWRRADPGLRLEPLVDEARRAGRWVLVDIDDPSLLPAGDMPLG